MMRRAFVAEEILVALGQRGPMSGSELVEHLHRAPGTVFPRLHRLVADRLVESLPTEQGPRGRPRTPYRLTAPGLDAYQRVKPVIEEMVRAGLIPAIVK